MGGRSRKKKDGVTMKGIQSIAVLMGLVIAGFIGLGAYTRIGMMSDRVAGVSLGVGAMIGVVIALGIPVGGLILWHVRRVEDAERRQYQYDQQPARPQRQLGQTFQVNLPQPNTRQQLRSNWQAESGPRQFTVVGGDEEDEDVAVG